MNHGFKERSAGRIGATIGTIILHSLCPALWCFFAIFLVPQFASIFSDMFAGATQLPRLTQVVLNLSNHMKVYWYAYLVLFILVLTIDAAVYHSLTSTGGFGPRVWSALVLIAEGVVTLALIASMALPLATAIQNLVE